MGDSDAYPLAVVFLSGDDRCATSAERVQHDIALVAGSQYDALQQGDRLLRGVAQKLFSSGAGSKSVNILPNGANHRLGFIEVILDIPLS